MSLIEAIVIIAMACGGVIALWATTPITLASLRKEQDEADAEAEHFNSGVCECPQCATLANAQAEEAVVPEGVCCICNKHMCGEVGRSCSEGYETIYYCPECMVPEVLVRGDNVEDAVVPEGVCCICNKHMCGEVGRSCSEGYETIYYCPECVSWMSNGDDEVVPKRIF